MASEENVVAAKSRWIAMSNRIEHITIVGGGTAGWLTAAILHSHHNILRDRQELKISVIESPMIPTIGVGESTISTMPRNMQRLGIDEAELIRRSNASFKLAVHFQDWARTPDGKPHNFYHPLNFPPHIRGYSPAYHFKRFGPNWPGTSLAENTMPNVALIKAGKGPRHLYGPNYDQAINYAYHIDASLFSQYIREVAISRGVEHIRDEVNDVIFDEKGAVSALQLERGGRHPVEFVIDCTGFKSVIIGKMRTKRFLPLGNRLLNDRAIPLQLPYRNPADIEPCTRATALGAGWVWRVPLYSRLGTGYVYSSAFRTDEEARDEFLGYLRHSGDLASDAPDPDTHVIQMRIGYLPEPWVKNCLAIGLSSGFVEPLEATAIFTIESSIARFSSNFPEKDCDPSLSRDYNRLYGNLMTEIADFLQFNYFTSNRTEPYWIQARDPVNLTDWLRDKIDVLQHRLPNSDDTLNTLLFGFWSYTFVMMQKGFMSKITFPLEKSIVSEDWINFGQNLKAQVTQLVNTLPSHHDLLTNIRTSGPGPQARSIDAILERAIRR
jgi:hypothetical protein